MHLAEFGMLMAIIGTLVHHEIVTYTWIITGLAIGSLVGLAMGVWVPMTAMPQRTALSHAFGAFAAALVGISEFYKVAIHGEHIDRITMSALGFEVMLGSLTTTGSLLAFAKLQGMVRGTPMTYKGQNIFNMRHLRGVVRRGEVHALWRPGLHERPVGGPAPRRGHPADSRRQIGEPPLRCRGRPAFVTPARAFETSNRVLPFAAR